MLTLHVLLAFLFSNYEAPKKSIIVYEQLAVVVIVLYLTTTAL